MASNELERAANSMESAARQILNGLEQARNVIEYYNSHELSTELSGLTADTEIVTAGNGITKARLVELADYADSALYHVYGDGDGAGNTLLGNPPDDTATMKLHEQKIKI